MSKVTQNYKQIVLEDTHSVQELIGMLKKVTDEAQKTRLRVLILVKQGKTKTYIAKEFGIERGTIIDWIKAYNLKGLDGLQSNLGGRPEGNPKWDATIFDELVEEINTTQKYWSVPLMMMWIQEKYEKNIPEQTVWYQITKRNYSYKSGRPHPYLGNTEKQSLFKKGGLQQR